jgi:phage-related minor tail protein
MGEAGPEAILPLRRLPSGDLGVRAEGGGAALSEPRVEVQIIDQRGAGAPPVQVSQSRGPDGRLVIRALVKDAMESLAGAGQLDRMMRRWGARPQPMR